MSVFVLEIAIGLLLILFWLCYLYMTSAYSYWKKRGVPYLKPSFPYGNIKDQVLNKVYIGTLFQTFYNQFPDEKYVGIFELGSPSLVLRDPEVIKMVMGKDFYHFADRGHIHEGPSKDYIAALHLFNLKGEQWKRMRSKLTPTFTSGKMKNMFTLIETCAQQLNEHVNLLAETNSVADMKELMQRFTCDVISTCAFGLETNCIKDKENKIFKISRSVFTTSKWNMIKLMLSINQPFLYETLGLEINGSDVRKFCMEVARGNYDYRVKSNVVRNDFIDLLIKIKQNKSLYNQDTKDDNNDSKQNEGQANGLTWEEMAAQIFVFFAAGFETSSSVSMMALYELALQPDLQNRLRREVDEILEKNDGKLTYQSFSEMLYMDQVLSETMRRYPTLPILTRKCTTHYRIPNSDLVLEKGTRVVIPLFALHHDPKYFPDPFKFDPERFNKDSESKYSYIHMPFGEGPMSCIGLRFGKMQVKTALVTMLSRYELSVAPETDIPAEISPKQFLTTPKRPIYLRLSKRSDGKY